MRKLPHALFALGLGLTLGAAAQGQAQAQAQQDDTLKIGTLNWAENIAVSHMWKQILEQEYGYQVELARVGKSVIFTGLASDDLDLSLEIWLPVTDKQFLAPHKEEIVVHDGWYEGTGLGLVVPSYVEIDTIPELGEHAERFSYQGQPTINGIDPGSTIAANTDDAIERYGLDMRQLNSSGPAMMAALDHAYQREAPIVVTLWNPHWAFADYDLEYLDDPKGIYGDSETIYWMSRKGFAEDDPWLTAVFDAWQMDDDSLGGLMARIEKVGDPVEGARLWIEDNRELIERWLAAGDAAVADDE